MLGRLFSSASHGRSPSALESATEEQYTRNLLFSDAPLSSSPPFHGTSIGQKVGSFDDYNGFEINEKDVRVIVAQDADHDRPSILFDTNLSKIQIEPKKSPQSVKTSLGTRHERTASTTVPNKSYGALQSEANVSSSPNNSAGAFHIRNRSFTVSGGQAGQPSLALRDADSKDATNDILECAFGASSSTKSGTRMHVIKSGNVITRVPTSPLTSPGTTSKSVRKPPLIRAQTSSTPSTDPKDKSGDIVLITRLFTVVPPDSDKELLSSLESSTPALPEGPSHRQGRPKPPKVRVTPAYAVSLVVRLPRKSSSRPVSRQGGLHDEQNQNPSVSTSFGSDLQSSWTFLDALPPSLSSSRSNRHFTIDGQIDFILQRWNMIVRHLSIIERIAKQKIFELLSQIEDTSSGRKPPKEKGMQRINQKIIRLAALALADDQDLYKNSLQAISYVCSALSIPFVRPLAGGQWLEEARLVTRLCNQKGKERFFVVMLTAFLGNHFEWIDEIRRELREKRLLLKRKSAQEISTIHSRTVIICEDRIFARRLVFLLGTLLSPGLRSLKPIPTSDERRSSARLHNERFSTNRSQLMTIPLSTSASSTDEDQGGRAIPGPSRHRLQRNHSETSSLRTARLSIPHQDPNHRKTNAVTTATVGSNPSTPLAYVSSTSNDSDGYFAAVPNVNSFNSAAAASLQRLRRSSSTVSSIPSTWGSLLGSIWSSKLPSSSGTTNGTASLGAPGSTGTSSQDSQRYSPKNQLETMVQEVAITDSPVRSRGSIPMPSSREQAVDIPPRLAVDEKDGVVDVDFKVPDSLLQSYASSPEALPAFPTPLSTSTASLDDARSSFSVRSSPQTAPEHVNSFAGYLKSYHPDFSLQAVRSCSEKEVRESMFTSTYVDFPGSPSQTSPDECNTLIADARNFTVKRLTLRRRPEPLEPDLDSKGGDDTRSQDEFTWDSILSYDETLAEAIDRALDKQSGVPSRLPSPSPSKSRHLRTVSTGTTPMKNPSSPLATSVTTASAKDKLQPVAVPQRNRGQFIIDALKEVVGEVDRDLHSSQRSENIPIASEGSSVAKPPNKEENVLREGVKRWLQDAEERSVW